MSTTPTTSTPATGNNKPSLTGVRIKQRKRVTAANAKFEPEIFRDALLTLLHPIPPTDYDTLATKLITAGSTLEYLKYADQLFEIVLVGGLLQPGGSYVDKELEKRSTFSVMAQQDESEPEQGAAQHDSKALLEEIKLKIEVLRKVIMRYKYLQKPLEKNVLPALVQYITKWSLLEREQLADAAALLIAQGMASSECLQNLTKDHLVKDSVSISFLTSFIRAYLSAQSSDHLLRLLKTTFKDLADVFPVNQRSRAHVEAHFKAEGLPQVAEWYSKRQTALVKEEMGRWIVRNCEEEEEFGEEWKENVVGYLTSQQAEHSISSSDILTIGWNNFMSTFEWSGSKDQVLRVKLFLPALKNFCKKPMEQVNFLQTLQVFCYDEQKAMKAFPSLVRLAWDAELVTDNAVIYWFDKGAKPQGKEFFLKSVQPLYDHITEEDDEDDEE
ncbi:Predicted translation factor, contains W2 domain [Phaffia rhodozyma]|uniref:Predicted translation factor, contains W2 domain n=1 Tax=Phaffia rhodozyma TaxID=264483 RepID=A0A0F7SMU5_PHARH|nr:Predicted translation factor, contains W2 domain [Phaffia rhodozyma]